MMSNNSSGIKQIRQLYSSNASGTNTTTVTFTPLNFRLTNQDSAGLQFAIAGNGPVSLTTNSGINQNFILQGSVITAGTDWYSLERYRETVFQN
jgi:hypothetical protein